MNLFIILFSIAILSYSSGLKAEEVQTEAASEEATSESTESSTKNKVVTPIYETYYDKSGKKQVRAYQYGFKLKDQLGSKEKNESVHYEKASDGTVSAYKWGYQLKDKVQKQHGTAPKGGILTHSKPAAASSLATEEPEMDEEEEAPSASSSGPNPEIRQKVMEMLKAQKASQ